GSGLDLPRKAHPPFWVRFGTSHAILRISSQKENFTRDGLLRNRRSQCPKSPPRRRPPATACPSYPEMGNRDAGMARKPSPRLPRTSLPGGGRHRDGRDPGRGRLAGMADAVAARATARDTDAVCVPEVRRLTRRAALV